MTSSTIVVHGMAVSGHTHRVEALLRILGVPYRLVDSPAEVRRTPAFRALNPLGHATARSLRRRVSRQAPQCPDRKPQR